MEHRRGSAGPAAAARDAGQLRHGWNPFASLKGRLGLGAGMIGLVAILSGALTLHGMGEVSQRITESLNAERRIARYSVLSTQISAFIAISAASCARR